MSTSQTYYDLCHITVRDYSDLIFISRTQIIIHTTMTQSNLKNDDSRTRNFFLVVFYASAVGMILITSYGLYISAGEYFKTGRIVIGEVLVNTDVPFSGFPKLVTYLMILSVITWYCVTKIGGEKVMNVPNSTKSILQLIAIGIAVIALYEFLYNFIIWSSLITDNALKGIIINTDQINIPYPNPETPWNLVFATKMNLAAFLISAHAFYKISKLGEKQIHI
jgi:hypothetical protein